MTPQDIILQILRDIAHLPEEDRLRVADEAIAIKVCAGYPSLRFGYPLMLYQLCCDNVIAIPVDLMTEGNRIFGYSGYKNAGEQKPWAIKVVRSFSFLCDKPATRH